MGKGAFAARSSFSFCTFGSKRGRARRGSLLGGGGGGGSNADERWGERDRCPPDGDGATVVGGLGDGHGAEKSRGAAPLAFEVPKNHFGAALIGGGGRSTWAFVAPPLIAACLGTGGVGVPGAEDKTLIAGDTSLAAATPSAGSVAHIAASARRLRTSIAKVALAKPSGSCHKTSGVIFRLSAIQKPPSPEERSRRTNEGMNAQRNEESMMAQACANARRTRKTRQCANIASCKARHIKRSTIWQTYEYPETKGMRA